MTLTEFLLARIAEDEAKLRGHGEYLDPFNPPRLLAECEAKRRIVEMCSDPTMPVDSGRFISAGVLALLALPYADHPDYREEWKL